LKIKCVDSRVNVNIFASTSVPFILTTVQVPNLALTHKKWITVYFRLNFVGNRVSLLFPKLYLLFRWSHIIGDLENLKSRVKQGKT
jgi:hypothetical protein